MSVAAIATPSPGEWLRRNLFPTWYHSALTAVFGLLLGWATFRALRFVFATGRWDIIRHNVKQLLVGGFPASEMWRVWAALFVLAAALSIFVGFVRGRARESGQMPVVGASPTSIVRRTWPVLTMLVVLFALRPAFTAFVLIVLLALCVAGGTRAGGAATAVPARVTVTVCLAGIVAAFVILSGFDGVGWDRWGGLMLTIFLAVAGILLSFPVGVLLALGRRSSLPVIRMACAGYIELIRGVPLIALLFLGSFVIGFVLPPGTPRPSLVVRAIVAFVMFTAAYVAEIVRGGLQAVPKEQTEAAVAVGLSPVATLRFVVLPQALRAVIPALVGQFISLFKDTSLVAILALGELLHRAEILTAQREFAGQQLQAETLVFASFIYWVGSYTMSRESQRLERRLGVGER